jgi:hypothetical protein
MDIDKLINEEKKRHDSNMSFLKRQKTIFEKSELRTDKERAVLMYKRLFKENNKLFQELLFKAKNNIVSPHDYIYSNMILESERQLKEEGKIL